MDATSIDAMLIVSPRIHKGLDHQSQNLLRAKFQVFENLSQGLAFASATLKVSDILVQADPGTSYCFGKSETGGS